MFPYIDKECGKQIALCFNSSNNKTKYDIITAFYECYETGIYKEIYNYKQCNYDMLIGTIENLADISEKSISGNHYRKFLTLINKWFEKLQSDSAS